MKSAKTGNDVLRIESYSECAHSDEEFIYIVPSDQDRDRWQLTISRDFAVELITEIARGLERDAS